MCVCVAHVCVCVKSYLLWKFLGHFKHLFCHNKTFYRNRIPLQRHDLRKTENNSSLRTDQILVWLSTEMWACPELSEAKVPAGAVNRGDILLPKEADSMPSRMWLQTS